MYPKTIRISNKKLETLMLKKGQIVNQGRLISEDIELLEKEMAEIDKDIQEQEAKVDISDINEKQKIVSAKVDEAIKEMEALKKEIYDRMLAQTSPESREKYNKLEKIKEEKELERNKIALKAQKYNDKIIPLGREMMKPFLEDQYEDYDSLYIEDGEIVATIFSHLADFKKNFKKK